ncbi:hypothetical protein EO95_13895 [Methanosarcina sp. 1.H.T.1A.1]|uniref:flippase n=1 Tax=Methanosarcina sp. 1.H.T.1A.1 TaxID=1483602 RepID=UPI00062196D9|nr:flippase [Methanosarcina sp. 1.H.T.1A.1]KKI00363.1 hypothetical protein EO95_13895 [Methanosarcina sp. 1.H.T.1A.1]
MNTIQKITKNTSVLFVAQIVSLGLGFLYTIYTARYLGAGRFGILCFALAFTSIFGVFADLGLNTLATREISRNMSLSRKYLGNIIPLKVILAIITLGFIVQIINLIGYSDETKKVVYIIALSAILTTFTGIFNSIFQAFEKMEYQSIGLILQSMLMFIGVLFALNQRLDIISFSFIYLVVNFIVLGYSSIICVWKFVLPKFEVDWSFWTHTIKAALPFGLTGISGLAYTYTDSVMLSLMQGDEVVGWYSAAYRLPLILLFIPSVINISIFPLMSRSYISSKSSLKSICEVYCISMLIIGIPIGVGTTALADKIILLIFGSGYEPSVIALKILIWTIVITYSGAAFVKLFESTNRQIVITKISGICLVVNIILNLLLIPKFSYIGASVATVITEFILVGSIFIYSYKSGYGIPGKKLIRIISKITVSSIIMGVFVWYFVNLNLLLLVSLAIPLYFGVLYMLRDRGYILELKQMKQISLAKNNSK